MERIKQRILLGQRGLEDHNLLKLRSLDSSFPFFLNLGTMNLNAPNAMIARLE